ncbi:uncharacterized protein LOC117602705 isoform X1 [Osmia lignaria lignaria]|uniref:uncharacterized protein LOC117602705 isoform X1 n=1 Tax=Osmia lignaria lignaria TaxID=1437193 RepID=UPI00402B86C8
MSLAVWHLLILWMILISCSIMSEARFPYVSEFEYIPRLHPSRNPDCPSRFVGKDKIQENVNGWNRPSIEIRAVLSRCTKYSNDFNKRRARRGYTEHQGITNCTRKIVINIRFNNIGKTEMEEKFIVIDHVLDSATMKKMPLQNPYVIKVRQEAVLQLYGLKFQSVVNAEAREDVINNESPNYTGCNVDPENPTCGQTFMRGEPVPFSQGFCCSCDPRVNARRQFAGSNDSVESFDAAAKSNYNDVANKPRNRLANQNGYTRIANDPMAERQITKNDSRSMKKSNTRPVNSASSETTGSSVSRSDARREKDARHKSIDRSSPMSLRGNKEENNHGEYLLSGKKEASNSRVTESSDSEKHSREREVASSTSVSSTRPEVSAGRTPSGDKTASNRNVACDRTIQRENVSGGKSGKAGLGEKQGNQVKMVDKENFNGGKSISDVERFNSVKKQPKNRQSLTENERNNREFQLVDSKTEVEKSRREGGKHAGRSKSMKTQNSSMDLTDTKDSFRSSKQELKKKWWKKAVTSANYVKEDGRKGESFSGNKGFLPKKRNKAFPVTSTIDSVPIRPAMHLNEPLKNLSTGVLNSNGSPVSQSARYTGKGNLNRVMEGTSRRPDIRVKSFNEKHGTVVAGSNGNEKSIRTLEDVGVKLISQMINIDENLLQNDDCFDGVKNRPCKGSIENYTPQKRTLKNLSYRKNRQNRDRRNQNEHEIDGYQSERNFRRSNGPFRAGRNRRRSKGRNEPSSRRGRRKRRSKNLDDDKGFASGNPNFAREVQVYIDSSRPLLERTNDHPRSGKFTHRRAKPNNVAEATNGQESMSKDNLDKRIEEKFSRINDVLKEDSMGSKGSVEEVPETPEIDKTKQYSYRDDTETGNKLEETNDVSSEQKVEETRDRDASNEATEPILEGKMNQIEDDTGLDTNLDLEAENLGKDEEINDHPGSNLPENKFEKSKSSTSNSDLVISPTMGSSMIDDQLKVTPDLSLSENAENAEDFALTKETSTEITQALIVVDLFKVVTNPLNQQQQTTVPKDTSKPSNRSTVVSRLGSLGKSIQKAFGLRVQSETTRQTFAITSTLGLNESTTTTENTTEATTTGVGTTKITDQVFRPSIKPLKDASKQTSGEFHNEVVIDELTFPDETNPPTTAATTLVRRRFDSEINLITEERRRKKKRMTPLAIQNKDSSLDEFRQPYRYHRSPRADNPWYHGGKKDSMKFSFEAENVNLMKEKLGSSNSFLREQRNYVQLMVNGQDDAEKANYGKGYRLKKDRSDPVNGGRRRKAEIRNSPGIKWIHHPWYSTTESSEYTVKSKNRADGVLPSRSLTNSKETGRIQKESDNLNQPEISGRILPPCSKSKYRRSRRLLSVKNSKSTKRNHQKTSKNKKKHAKDDEDDEYEKESSKHLKSLRSRVEKSKKRDTERASSKRNKSNKNRSKKQLQSPLEDSFEGYDYSMPKEPGYEVLEERQAKDVGNPEESLENDETVPFIEESAQRMIPGDSRIQENVQNDDSYSRLADNSVPVDFDRLTDNSKAEDSVLSEKDGQELGKDFEISLTGKIHLESDSNGRPVSISFNAAPEFLPKSSIDSGTMNEYVDRLPSESASSSLVDASNTDNANFLSNAFGAQPVDSDETGDQSKEYSGVIRERNGNAVKYRDVNRPQKLLRLQKKSVDAIENADEEETRLLKGLHRTDEKYSPKDSGSTNLKRDVESVSKETEAKDGDVSSGSEDLKNVLLSDSEDSPQISLDLSNEPEASFLNAEGEDAATTVLSGGCYALNSTTERTDLPETTTVVEKMAAFANTPLLSYQDLNTTEYPSTTEQLATTITMERYDSVQEETLPPQKQQAFGFSKSVAEYNTSAEDNNETTEKKNMQAVSEFVKKLEKLVTDAGNSSNQTGSTLIHLKKFIIVPDNQTFWSLGKLSEPEVSPSSSTETVVLMGEGVNENENVGSVNDKEDDEVDEESKPAESDLIKGIIRSVIRGDDEKRDVTGCGTGKKEEHEEPSKNNNVCKEDKSNMKEKREASMSNAGRERKRESKKKDSRQGKKKRRRKRKRKPKKKKKNANKKNDKKIKSKWPFKRNLLMLSEEEQIETPDCGNKWRIIDKFSLCEKNKNRIEPKKSGENKFKEPQIRGGQDCSNHRHPPNVDPSKYLESAHCLRFSNLWYSVYQLEEPFVAHKIHLQIYVKGSSVDGSIFWQDLTNGSSVRLGTFDKHYRDTRNSMDFTYNDIKLTPNTGYNLDPTKDRLLVPSTLSEDTSKYPEIEGWSGEYLVVQADKINEDANECDKAGVGFTAFVNQPDRCERVRGTCLKNQPMDYWRHDVEARDSGRSGCYFLSNFAWVPSEAIKYNVNGTGSREFLALEYHSPHVSVIDVELGADYNALLRAGSYGRLTEVYIDNTAIDYTVITVLITNKGSSSSSYRVRITDCPEGLPVSWLNAESPSKTISSHHDRKVALDLYGRLSLNEFSCSVELLNSNGEPVATRRIKTRKMDRCFCVRHCVCTCDGERTSCQPMSLENYHAAGFRGPLPPTPDEPFIWFNPITIVCLFIIGVLLLLLLLGIFKWLIGLCLPAVGRWGLDALFETNKMKEYFEKDLKSRSVVLDESGQPVHPDTRRKSVRVCNRKLEFFLNLIFFFIYPLVICCWYCMKPRHPSKSTIPVESQASLMSEKEESPTMICVSTYGDSINSKMEAEDTKYVIDELKKSQESLQNLNRYKRKPESPETVPSSSD